MIGEDCRFNESNSCYNNKKEGTAKNGYLLCTGSGGFCDECRFALITRQYMTSQYGPTLTK